MDELVSCFIGELLRLGCRAVVLDEDEASRVVGEAISKFNPVRTTGHVQIGHVADSYPSDLVEFEFSGRLDSEAGYLFFGAGVSGGVVIRVEDVSCVARAAHECGGLEYFLVNESLSYMIAVCWYAVQVVGTACENFRRAWPRA